MADWTCRCSAKNGDRDRYCEGCGAENPKTPVRPLAPAPKVPETNAPWHAPTYPDPTPEDDALIRAEIARAKVLLGMVEPTPRRLGLPPIDPAIREKLR